MRKTVFEISALVFLSGMFFMFVLHNVESAQPNDLAVEDMVFLPSYQVVNMQSTITVKVKNNGTQDIDAEQFLKNYSYTFDNFIVSQFPLPSGTLTAGSYFYYNFIGYYNRAGDAKINFGVDSANQLNESSEDNNSIEKTVSVVLSENDLAVDSITITPSSFFLNKKAIITVKVKNNGLKVLADPMGTDDFQYSLKNFTITNSVFPRITLANPIPVGGYIDYVLEGKFIAIGDSLLSFRIDDRNLLEENNENNNYLEKTVKVGETEKPDVSIKELKLVPADSILSNSGASVLVTIENKGDSSLVDSTGLTDKDILMDFRGFDTMEKSHDSYPTLDNPLNPGGTFTYSYKGKFTNLGNNILSFKADSNNNLGETDMNNNATSTTIMVYATEKDRDDFNFLDNRAEPMSTTSVKVYWRTDKNTSGKFYGAVGGEFMDSTIGKEHSAIATNLPNSINYSYKLVGVNNTVLKESGYYNIKLPLTDYLTVGSGPQLKIDDINKDINISWTTNLASSGSVYYKNSKNSSFIEVKCPTPDLSMAHDITFPLSESGDYDYYIVSTSTAGTIFTSKTGGFTLKSLGTGTNSNNSSASGNSASSSPTGTMVSQSPSRLAGQPLSISNTKLYYSLKGKIILKIQSRGEAYYIAPDSKKMYYLGKAEDAYAIIRELGVGITNANLEKIPLGLAEIMGNDSDQDGLPDPLEVGLGTDKNKKDSDNDGFEDKIEILSGYSPKTKNVKMNFDFRFAAKQKGKIFIQVQGRGEAWYLNPSDGKRYFLGQPGDAYNLMWKLGLGISNKDFNSL